MARRRRRWGGAADELLDMARLEGVERESDEVVEVEVAQPDPDSADLHELLRTAPIVGTKAIPWGSNYSFFAVLERVGAPGVVTVYKPRRGEVPLWDFPDGTLYRREFAAYTVARALGMGFIPPTVIRDGPHGVGTFQLFVEPDESIEYQSFRRQHVDELCAISLFDLIANNADRKSGHCFKGIDGRIWGIDHGLCFNVVPKLRTVIWDFCGKPIPEALLGPIWELATDPVRSAALRTDLLELLHDDEVEAFFVRLGRLAEEGHFPVLDPYRNVPRGWF